MPLDTQENESSKPPAVQLCEDMRDSYLSNRLDEREYYMNITFKIFKGTDEEWAACLDIIPKGLERNYLEYLHREVVAHDYMPYPRGYVLPSWGPEAIETVKREKRPKYVALVALLERRLA